MNVCTIYRQSIFCLPDDARCKLSWKSPLEMDECPVSSFDNYGDICIPELCDKYEEGEPTPHYEDHKT